jgi:hypothetical protein
MKTKSLAALALLLCMMIGCGAGNGVGEVGGVGPLLRWVRFFTDK